MVRFGPTCRTVVARDVECTETGLAKHEAYKYINPSYLLIIISLCAACVSFLQCSLSDRVIRAS
jgi:hypothetical protein